MAKTEVISIRIDSRLLVDLEECVRKHRWHKRNNVIEKAVEMFVRNLSHHEQHIVLSHNRFSPTKLVCSAYEEEPEKAASEKASSM